MISSRASIDHKFENCMERFFLKKIMYVYRNTILLSPTVGIPIIEICDKFISDTYLW